MAAALRAFRVALARASADVGRARGADLQLRHRPQRDDRQEGHCVQGRAARHPPCRARRRPLRAGQRLAQERRPHCPLPQAADGVRGRRTHVRPRRLPAQPTPLPPAGPAERAAAPSPRTAPARGTTSIVAPGPGSRWQRTLSEPMFVTAFSLMTNTVLTNGLGVLFWVVAARLYRPSAVGRDSALVSLMMALSTIGQLD